MKKLALLFPQMLPQECEAMLRVYDASGRLSQEHIALYPAGKTRGV